MDAITSTPVPVNEPIRTYAPGSPERESLQRRIAELENGRTELTMTIAGQRRMAGGEPFDVVKPHDREHVLGSGGQATGADVAAAVRAAKQAAPAWRTLPYDERASVLLRAADLLAGPWRDSLNASTMLGQSKSVFQAEIDAAAELIDFLRFNVYFGRRILEEQPLSAPGMWNRMDHRPLEGFVYAITPFNFTAIGGNLPTAPALMGNSVVWKPSATAMLSNWFFYKLLEEAGLPPGVINFLPGDSVQVSETLLSDRRLAGIHFTGSTPVFQSLWRTVASNLDRYAGYPRIVGETGGKDFILAHPSADVDALAVGMVRGAYEYQGQKCSAASRAYIPDSLWPAVRDRVVGMIEDIRIGDVADFRNFMGAVIDRRAFTRLRDHLEAAKQDPGVKVLAGGGTDDSVGFFVQPTLLQVEDPGYRLMCEEIFGPVLAVHVYPEGRWRETLTLVDQTSPYALTGAVFSRDRRAITEADHALRHSAGNYYINDKPTGAVVGQQPFGGSRASGTNDKAGSILNLLRWVSPRSIKETLSPPRDYRYPYMEAE
jgi:1-pyrroline-5-carboxylate dehydrogenase